MAAAARRPSVVRCPFFLGPPSAALECSLSRSTSPPQCFLGDHPFHAYSTFIPAVSPGPTSLSPHSPFFLRFFWLATIVVMLKERRGSALCTQLQSNDFFGG